MCGIVGLFCKASDLEPQLGLHLGAMLAQMDDRGPDSAGVAVYRDPAPPGSSKLTLFSFDPDLDWESVRAELEAAFGDAEIADVWVRRHRPDLRVMSAGRVIEIYKEVGRPKRFIEDFRLAELAGSHG